MFQNITDLKTLRRLGERKLKSQRHNAMDD